MHGRAFHFHKQTLSLFPRASAYGNQLTPTCRNTPLLCHLRILLNTYTLSTSAYLITILIILIMSSINDPQKQDAPPGESDTVGKGVFSNIITEIPPSPQNEQDEHDLASQTARLALDEHTTNAVPPHNPSTTTSLGGESDSTTMDENVNPKPAHATTAPQPESEPADKNQADEAIILAKLKEGDKILLSESNATLATADDLDSPRFTTYLKLHNDVSCIAAPPAFAVD